MVNDEILAKLKELWYYHPDWRFGQLIYNVLFSIPATKRRSNFIDPFFLDDETVLKYLEEMVRKEDDN